MFTLFADVPSRTSPALPTESKPSFLSRWRLGAARFAIGASALGLFAPAAVHAQAQSEPQAQEPSPNPLPAPAPAPSPFSFSGFGTLGAVHQSGGQDWRFVRNITQLGPSSRLSASPDSRLGAQLNWDGGPQWEAGVQGVVLSRPRGTPAEELIQWGYVGYRPTSSTRIRVGRTNPDVFLFADSRNVGYALPWARPPADFYAFFPLASIDGVDLEQQWFSGGATWRARATAGNVRTSATEVNGERLALRGRDTMALGLSREDGGLLLKASILRSQVRLHSPVGVAQLRDGLDQLGSLPIPGLAQSLAPLDQNLWTGGATTYLSLATQYETGPWTFIAEGSRLRVPGSPLNARRGYVSVGWRRGAVTYYGLASRVKPDDAAASAPELASSLAPVIGPAAAQQAQMLAGYAAAAGDNYRFDQSTVSAGLRWDFLPNAALKLQVDRFNVRQHGGAGWRFYDGSAGKGTLVSVLVDFVWGQ